MVSAPKYNYIGFYANYLGRYQPKTTEEKLRIIEIIGQTFINGAENKEEEMKRFIAYLHGTYSLEKYEYMVENDKTGFLKECIALYDPKTGLLKAPVSVSDYRENFKN